MTALFLSGILPDHRGDIFIENLLIDAAALKGVVYAVRIKYDTVAGRNLAFRHFAV